MKIDLHTHILPETWPDLAERYGYGGFIRLDHHQPCRARMMMGDKFFREVEDNCWSPARRIEDCDRAGVGVQVLSTVPVMFSYWAKPEHTLDLSRMLNDHLAEVCRRFPDRFVGLATLPMQAPELAISELERCMKPADRGGLGLAGIEIGTHVNDWNLNEPAVIEVLAAAERLGAALLMHPWDMMGAAQMPRYWLPWLVGMPAETARAICSMLFGGVFERLPKLRVCFAHGGGAFAFTIGRIEHGFRCRPDLVAVDNDVNPRAYLAQPAGAGETARGCASDGTPLVPARFWVDALVHDARSLRMLLALFSDRRVCLGSDYPFPLGEAEPGALIESMADLPEQVRERLLHGAAEEFLGLDAP